MTAWPTRLLSLVQHGLRDTMAPWLAVSLSLHAGLVVAILPERQSEDAAPNAGSVIAVDIVIVEGPDARSTMATGERGDLAAKPDRARKAERRAARPAAPEPVTEPVAEPAPPVAPQTVAKRPAPEAVPPAPDPSPAPTATVTAKAPPASSAPVILAPRPRRKPPPPVKPAARPLPRRDAPADNTAHAVESDADEASAEIAAATPVPAALASAPAGGSRGASPQPGNPKPVYPYSARRQGRQGRVVLRVEVRPDGAAGMVFVDQTSGDASLDEAALAAVRRWRFRPARRNGAPVAANVQVPIRFSLR
jgi:protein TonB